MTFLYRADDLPDSFDLLLYSDVHVGSKSFHEKAFVGMLRELKTKSRTYAVCLGDLVEGQATNHPHYDSTTIAQSDEYDFNKPGDQFAAFEEYIAPVAAKHLGILLGNHDWRHEYTDRFVGKMCKRLGVHFLGPRAHLTINKELNLFLSHKGKRYTNSQGSPTQQEAAMQESCRRFFTRTGGKDFWQSAHGMFHGDTHQLLLAPPHRFRAQLMSDSTGKHSQRAVPSDVGIMRMPDGLLYVPPEARWVGATGTFRRGGTIQDVTETGGWDSKVWFDYSEKDPYKPADIGYIHLVIKNNRIVDGKTVVV